MYKRQNLGFEGTPIILIWRGKQQRTLEREITKKGISLIDGTL